MKMNSDYKPTEKMNYVTLDISADEVKPYLFLCTISV